MVSFHDHIDDCQRNVIPVVKDFSSGLAGMCTDEFKLAPLELKSFESQTGYCMDFGIVVHQQNTPWFFGRPLRLVSLWRFFIRKNQVHG
jgi:hypothetical protein